MKQALSKVKEPKKFDFLLLGIIIVMAMTSLVAIYSAFELLPAYQSGTDLIFKQVMWYGFGFIAMAAIMYVGNDNLFEMAKIAYWFLMVALLLLLLNQFVNKIFPGKNLPFIHEINGATSWYNFPGIGSFQPSEFMKVVLIIITAGVIERHNSERLEATFENDLILFIKILKWAIPPVILILIQPDTGIVIIIGISLAMMIMCSGIRREWIILAFTLIALVLGVFFYLFFYQNDVLVKLFGGNYKLGRIVGWIYPEENYIGEGQQLYTALLALGSAGIFGYGLQSNVVTLLEPQTDFIFAVFGQSFGLIGTIFILLLCIFLDWRLFKIATHSKNTFEKLIICGILGMLLFQQIQNIGMVIGLLPITGITLPLISYGGSSLLSYLIAFGVIMNASARAHKLSDFVYD